MRVISFLLILIFFTGCSVQNGVNKNYIISQMDDKESGEKEVSE
jgi:hypothetical protein